MSFDNNKPIILCFLAYYLPGFRAGGPLRTISNLVSHIGTQYRFKIVTRDRDSLSPQRYPSIQVNDWNKVKLAEVFYASPSFLSTFRYLFKTLKCDFDVVYLNSFFDIRFSLLPLLFLHFFSRDTIPLILAPRGEFSPGARSIKPLRKQIYISLFRIFGLYRHLIWQASSSFEYDDIVSVFPDIHRNIFIASDLPAPVVDFQESNCSTRIESSALSLVFLSRINPVKNLHFLVSSLSKCTSTVSLSVYGPIDDSCYWSYCLELANDLPPNVEFNYLGEIDHCLVSSVLSSFDLFVLPTLGENFGHAILESLMSSTPVLISDKTPWRSTSDGAINCLTIDDINPWVAFIDNYSFLSCDQRQAFRDSALNFSVSHLSRLDLLSDNEALFRYAISLVNT